ncbi:WbuC family cupin fold metalloprotein [Vibrio vulnificus]|uniref:WbuC family cupin fold metalloprotein n=1 Tax=Vibrio vulnificus TaxID=672 RepID=UPI00102CE229|nr:WbuC family cupin fold metalloprotein [Vibrio vulnificus]MCA3908100.1 WbuC family cupin fold metalloprotein [Vibrio vulnificus]NVC43436.1 cupin fold metalloprotein, WbuC family [Vibrio vulnificus]RZR41072.1 cupin fold metalloprotein, WbuC family [Vibrio vulnificus]
MKVYSDQYLNMLFDNATDSPRKRVHLNLHASYDEKVQRLFIALTRGSFVEPHYHELEHQWEMFVVLKGVIRVKHYNNDGNILSELLVGDEQETKVIEFHPRDIHSVECVSEVALMLEIKEGPFDPNSSKKMLG